MVSENELMKTNEKKITDHPGRLIQRKEIQKEGFFELEQNVLMPQRLRLCYKLPILPWDFQAPLHDFSSDLLTTGQK